MAITKITYSNKVDLNENTSIANINKVMASDMNEIKAVVNNNANTLDTLSNNLSPTVLYSNTTGVNTPVPLSDSLSNYTYIEVYTIDGYGGYSNYSCTRAMVSIGNSITIQNAVANTDSQVIWEITRYTMSNTALTRVYGLSPRIATSGASLVQNSDRTKIIKVLGYK